MAKPKRVDPKARPRQPGVEPAGALVGMAERPQLVAAPIPKGLEWAHDAGIEIMHVGPSKPDEARIVQAIVPLFADGLWCPISRDHGPTFERIAKRDLERGWTEGKEVGNGYRRIDPLVAMQRAGTISDLQLAAGWKFRDKADTAMLDPMRAADYGFKVGGSKPSAHLLPGHIEDARVWVHEAISELGGHGSQMAAVCWWVVGVGLSIADFTRRATWSGRPVNPVAVGSKVEAALSVLAPWIERRRKREREDVA